MKFWQLESICREQPGLLSQIAAQQDAWKQFGEWDRNFHELVDTQNRAILDWVLPEEYARAVLAVCSLAFYVSEDESQLRASRSSPSDEEISALEADIRYSPQYGGGILEDVLEKGSHPISGKKLFSD